MKILYAGSVAGTAAHRLAALRRLGHEVDVFDFTPYAARGSRAVRWLRWRVLAGPTVAALNRDLLARAGERDYGLLWFDKAQMVRAATVAALAARGLRTVHYSSDLPSAVRGDVGWRLFRRAVPHYDTLVAPSTGHFAEYRALGARRVLRMPFGYDPEIHQPPRPGEVEPVHDIGFVGTPYGDRPQFLLSLARDHGLRVKVWGDLWARVLSASELRLLQVEPGVYGDAYRRALGSARICLGLVTEAMAHGSARRWVEIAACGGFLLAKRTPESEEWFVDGREAVFFDDVTDCAAAVRRYLDDADARAAIAAAGRARVVDRCSNDRLLADVLGQLDDDDAAPAPLDRKGTGS